MAKSRWYIDFFGGGFYSRSWAPADRFETAVVDAEFIAEVLDLPAGAAVLDLCCGEGRHTIALARRGYQMTGLDLSADHLREARRRQREAGVSIRWHRADMREIPWESEFDAVINMWSSFGYFDSEEEDIRVLDGIARSLKPGGGFLIDTMNREWLARNWQPHGWTERPDGTLILEDRRFDLLAGRQHNRVLAIRSDGTRVEREIHLRMYSLKELADMVSRVGLVVCGTWGGFDGQEYGLDSRRMIVLSEKSR